MATNISASTGNRVVCCCCDCQAFARFLEQEKDILDQFGGTDIYQTSQSQVSLFQGADELQSMRLTPKGLLRWYTGCCNTPVGNTVSAALPIVGVVHNFMASTDRNTDLGPVRAYVQTQYAIGEPDYPHSAPGFPPGITLRIMRKMLLWKIRGMGKPSQFFGEDGKPVVKPIVLES